MEKIAFLNGELGFHDDYHKKYFDKLNGEGKEVYLVDNLFNRPANISKVSWFDTIVVGTVGFEIKKIEQLFEEFKVMIKHPNTVIFAPSEDPFVSMAFEMDDIKFYRLDYSTLELTPLNYLNE
jgi:hypothetical protein